MSLALSIFRGGGTMENDTFGGAILAWVKNPPGMRHMPEKMQEARIYSPFATRN